MGSLSKCFCKNPKKRPTDEKNVGFVFSLFKSARQWIGLTERYFITTSKCFPSRDYWSDLSCFTWIPSSINPQKGGGFFTFFCSVDIIRSSSGHDVCNNSGTDFPSTQLGFVNFFQAPSIPSITDLTPTPQACFFFSLPFRFRMRLMLCFFPPRSRCFQRELGAYKAMITTANARKTTPRRLSGCITCLLRCSESQRSLFWRRGTSD